MSLLSSALRASSRTMVRATAAGALAVGLLAATPAAMTASADAATAHRTADRTAARTAHKISTAVAVAANQKGDPYRYGADGPNAFDCSGLMYYSFRKAGFSHMPRTSSAQSHFARHISKHNMRRGDLIFFYDGGGVYHVGVFVGFSHGHRLILHAPHSGTRVQVDRLWTSRWFAGTLRRG
jgi:cell wall-associated NlpC family hydrolase